MADKSPHELLSEARQALHDLLTGQQLVQVGYDGRQTTYNIASIDKLRQYINELEAKCGIGGRRRPFHVDF